jgi:DHA2 family multidrug resistance protein-like MFS transporter
MGPLLGGALLDRFWWGSVFLLVLPVALLLLVVGPLVLPEFRDPDAARFDVLGAVQSLVALLAIVYAIKRVAEQGSPLEAGAAAVFGIVLGAAFVRRQRRAARPMVDPALFRNRTVRVALVGSTLTFFALYGTNVGLAQYLQWVIGLTPLQAGLWTIPSVLAYLAGTALGPVVVSRFSRVQVMAAGLLLSAVGCGLFAAVLVGAFNNLAVIITATVTFALGLAPVYTMSTDLIMANTSPERAGAASAVAETGVELGGALGIALLGSLGVTIYRNAMTPTAGLSPAGIDDTRRTFGEAVAVARTVPGQQGAELLQHARSAFEVAFAAMGGAACLVILAALTTITVISVRARRRDGQEVEADAPVPSEPAIR